HARLDAHQAGEVVEVDVAHQAGHVEVEVLADLVQQGAVLSPGPGAHVTGDLDHAPRHHERVDAHQRRLVEAAHEVRGQHRRGGEVAAGDERPDAREGVRYQVLPDLGGALQLLVEVGVDVLAAEAADGPVGGGDVAVDGA